MKLDYYNLSEKGLSYSRQLTLHSCGRKYELDSKKAIKGKIESVTFSYGHAVGQAIQSTMAGASFNRTVIDTVLAYSHDEDDLGCENEQKSKKNIWWAVIAAEEFYKKYHAGVYSFLEGWQVATFPDPKTGEIIDAVELTFVVKLIDGYSYEGHIDLVLYHPVKKRYMILELKTTGMTTINEASYKNSAQALGYGIVVDMIAANLNASASYDVLYMVYKSRTRETVPLLFTKSPALRVDWLSALLTDMQIIELYEQNGYPRHGESCFNFFRPCEYLDVCNMSDESIDRIYGTTTDLAAEDDSTYSQMLEPMFIFTIEELMERQEQLIKYATSGTAEAGDDLDMLLDVVQVHT